MKRLALLVTRLSLIPTILCFATIAFARSQRVPAALQAKGIDICDSRPCLLGVTPGITLWNDAQAMLDQGRKSHRENSWISIEIDDYTHAVLPRYKYDATITDILISFRESPPTTVGSMITQYGPPCLVLYNRASGGIVLRYPFMFATTFLPSAESGHDAGFLDANSPLSTLNLHGDLDPCAANRGSSDNLVYTPWLGFAAVRRYVVDGAKAYTINR